MKKLLLKWIILAVSLVLSSVLTSLVLPQQFIIKTGFPDIFLLFVGVAVLALINATLGSLLRLMLIPLNCLTLGLVSLLINAALFYLVGTFGLGFEIKTFLAALIGSILFSACNGVLQIFVKDEKKEKED